MGETENYNFYLENDSSVPFKEWREKMNGEGDSNMVRADTALTGKADKSLLIEGLLSAAGWVGEQAPFTQALAVSGISSDGNGLIFTAETATKEQYMAAADAGISILKQRDGELVLMAKEKKPEIDIPVCVMYIG